MPGRTSTRLLPASLIALAVAALALFGAPATEAAADQGASQAAAGCKGERIRTADGCVRPKRARKEILAITRQLMAEKGLRAAILQVRVGRRMIVSKGLGTSMAGVKASPRMNFRIGSMAITLLTNLLLQLRDEGRLRLDAPLSK